MIISKKKYQEDIRKAVEEAINRVEHEEWVRSRLNALEREMNFRFEENMIRVMQLEERLEAVDPIKDPIKERRIKESAEIVEWKACPICLRMRKGED